MRQLSLLCMRRPVACMAVWAAFGILTLLALPRIAVEGMSPLQVPVLRVITVYPQTPPEAVELEITIPLENALSSVPGVTRIESVTKLGVTRTTLHLRLGDSAFGAASRVREQIDALYPSFPHGAAKPVVLSSQLSRRPAAVLAVVPDSNLSFAELSSITRDQLLPILEAMPQFAEVHLRAYRENELQIRLMDRLLGATELDPEQIATRVSEALRPYALGSVEQNGQRNMLRMAAEASSPEHLAKLPLRAAVGLGQLSAIEVGETAVDEFFLVDAQPALGIEVYAAPGVGEIRAVAALSSALPGIKHRFAGRVQLRMVDEAGSALLGAVVSVAVALCLGVVVAFVVLLPSFRRPSLALLPAAALPATLVAVLPVLELLGVSINLITLSGFVVGLGMVFDNAIMVTDRLLSLPLFGPEAGAHAVGELGEGLFAATATTMIVLLPVFALQGTLGLLFGEAALVMLLLPPASLLSAVTLVPALCTLVLHERHTVCLNDTSLQGALPARALPQPRRIHAIVILGASLLGVAVLVAQIPRETLPQTPGLGYELQLRFAAGTAVESTQSQVQTLYAQFLRNPQLDPLYARGGVGSSDVVARSGTDEAQNTARLFFHAQPHLDLTSLAESIRRSLPDALIELHPRTDQATAALSSLGERAAFLQAGTREELASVAANPEVFGWDGSELNKTLPTIQFSLDPQAVLNSDSSPAAVLGALQFIGEGRHIADIRIEGRERPVRLFLEAAGGSTGLYTGQDSVTTLEGLELFLPAGPRTLNLLGSVKRTDSPEALYRSNRHPALPVPSAVVRMFESSGGLTSSGKSSRLPPGAFIFNPAQERSVQIAWEIGVAVVAAVLLILLLLSAVFESLRKAILVLASTFPCVAVALFAVRITGGSINLGVGLGLIMLFGNAVNTTILPTSLVQTGDVRRSAPEAVRLLGRGILFSTLSTAAALVPSLLAGLRFPGIHSYTALPLFAGLLFGTPLSLVVFLGLSKQRPANSFTRKVRRVQL